MINNKSVLAIIPARGGSKGVIKKNIREVAGKPLIAWTIVEARKSKYIDRLILTSDDEEIIEVAKKWDCDIPFVRPKELAQDDTPGIEPVLHALEQLKKYEYVVLLQPTSPMRLVESIDNCIEKIESMQGNAVVSVSEPNKNPFWMYKLNNEEKLVRLISEGEIVTRRQELPKTFVLNGAVYVARYDYLLEKKAFLTEDTMGYIMPQEQSFDIDTELDLEICDLLLRKRR